MHAFSIRAQDATKVYDTHALISTVSNIAHDWLAEFLQAD